MGDDPDAGASLPLLMIESIKSRDHAFRLARQASLPDNKNNEEEPCPFQRSQLN